MVSITRRASQQPIEDDLPPLVYVSPAEGRRMFDEAAREWTGMTGDEFIVRWKAGEFAELPDDLEHRRILELVVMIPLAFQDV